MLFKSSILTHVIIFSLLLAACAPTPTTAEPPSALTSIETPTLLDPIPEEPLIPHYPTGLTFVDPLHGWIRGWAYWNQQRIFAMASTSDGGRTWQAIPVPDTRPPNTDQGKVSATALFFVNSQDGWAFGSGLFSTHDGGFTWTDEHPNGAIKQFVTATDGTVLALEEKECGCDWSLYIVSGSYKTWQVVATKLPFASRGSLFIADVQNIVFAHPDPANINWKILATHDGGINWQQSQLSLPQPCADTGGYNHTALSIVDQQHFWLGCGGRIGAGAFGTTFIYASADGGKSWELKAKGNQPPADDDTIHGALSDFRAVTPANAFVTFYRAGHILITDDGGKTWRISQPVGLFEAVGFHFIDPLHGWAFGEWQAYFNRTTDGGKTWECIELPDSTPCSAETNQQ